MAWYDPKDFPDIPQTAQGPAVPANEEDLKKDKIGFTHPNLHRRIAPQPPAPDSEEYKARDYVVQIRSVDSYRTTTINFHDEESETSEIP